MPFITASGRLEILADRQPRPEPCMVEAVVLAHHHVADRYWLLRLRAPEIARVARPGQFVMLTVAHAEESTPVLPRPMAIYTADRDNGSIDVMYGVVGAGTTRLTRIVESAKVTTVGPLGQAFTLAPQTQRILLLGRGIGTCSLTALAFVAAARSVEVIAVDSARSPHALIADEAYRAAGVTRLLQVVDSDGSSAVEAVRDTLLDLCGSAGPEQIYTCGARRFAALAGELADAWSSEVQVSLEAHMACGIGYCHGCASGTQTADDESPLICRDGPVFRLVTPEMAGER